MPIVITTPKNNETMLVDRALELGYTEIIFLYQNKIEKFDSSKIKTHSGLLIAPKSNSELSKLVNKFYTKADLIAVTSKSETLIRAAFENKKVDLVFGICTSSGRDHTHYRHASFNQVLANLAKKNKIVYGVDFADILELEGIARAKLLGREMQNLRLTRRKIPIVISSFTSDPWKLRGIGGLTALLQIMGLNSTQSKEAVSKNILRILKRNKARKSEDYIADGIRIVK